MNAHTGGVIPVPCRAHIECEFIGICRLLFSMDRYLTVL